MSDAKFKLLNRFKIEDIESGIIKEIGQSDLAFQTDKYIVQYEYFDEDEDGDKYPIKPGIFTMVSTTSGVKLEKLELKTHNLLETATNTRIIEKEANTFFNKLDVYKKYKLNPKRSILLYSQPGMGKSSTIAKLSQDFVKEDPGTVVVFWDTCDLRPSTVSKFLSTGSFFTKKCTRMIFVMEDIGGGNAEDYHGPKTADSGLLELLDGASVSFRLPTFIIATTNTPENLLKSLADRPGRFDQMFELEGPNSKERVLLAEHISGGKLAEEQILALKSKDADGFSIAHINEIVIRSELHGKTYGEVIVEMKNHKKKIEAAFQKMQSKMGL